MPLLRVGGSQMGEQGLLVPHACMRKKGLEAEDGARRARSLRTCCSGGALIALLAPPSCKSQAQGGSLLLLLLLCGACPRRLHAMQSVGPPLCCGSSLHVVVARS